MLLFQDLNITWLGHDGFLLEHDGFTICIDPFRISKARKVDVICITHSHFDHLSVEDIAKLVGPETIVICPKECASALQTYHPRIISPGQSIQIGSMTVKAVVAYNTNKFREGTVVFHPKSDGKLGYLMTLGGIVVYHTGDTDKIPEMENYTCDVALLPVSGTYVMTAEEAIEAALVLSPKLVIPMHYGSIVGSLADAKRFSDGLSGRIRVEILDVE